ncbi:adenosylcobinamide amidohydrolase [Vulcanisaeta sp. JCM 16161]|uniref:adenosylcobinamide amidohydrolase n=1 Tax=Vulcanisaeta sp. JCM 16161 TaxID=1295372 RepID=UPI000A512881|nr:adenosylcobinamide amidohydrolase [Vulcanisaeta sp. JCM 16161]
MIQNIKYLGRNIVITLNQEATALASTVDGGLRSGIKYIIHHQVPKNFNEEPTREIEKTHRELAIRGEEAITFLTATELPRNHVMRRETTNDIEVYVSITIGLTNPYKIEGSEIRTWLTGVSTINMAIIVNKPLTIQAMIDAITLAAQTKALTLAELTGNGMHGTTTDAIAILTPTNGDKEPYAGPATAIGKAWSTQYTTH